VRRRLACGQPATAEQKHVCGISSGKPRVDDGLLLDVSTVSSFVRSRIPALVVLVVAATVLPHPRNTLANVTAAASGIMVFALGLSAELKTTKGQTILNTIARAAGSNRRERPGNGRSDMKEQKRQGGQEGSSPGRRVNSFNELDKVFFDTGHGIETGNVPLHDEHEHDHDEGPPTHVKRVKRLVSRQGGLVAGGICAVLALVALLIARRSGTHAEAAPEAPVVIPARHALPTAPPAVPEPEPARAAAPPEPEPAAASPGSPPAPAETHPTYNRTRAASGTTSARSRTVSSTPSTRPRTASTTPTTRARSSAASPPSRAAARREPVSSKSTKAPRSSTPPTRSTTPRQR
jgi:hypothetical protein